MYQFDYLKPFDLLLNPVVLKHVDLNGHAGEDFMEPNARTCAAPHVGGKGHTWKKLQRVQGPLCS